jgi:hypothetical protein
MCDGHVDGVTVFSGSGSDERDLVRVEADEPIDDFGSLALGNLDSAIAEAGLARIYAWSSDNSRSARGPSLTEADLSSMAPGQILSINPPDSSVRVYNQQADFIKAADQICEQQK